MVGIPGKARRFFEEVVIPYQGDDCLIWPFARLGGRYAALHRSNGRKENVAILICERLHGPRPSPKHVTRHSCGNGTRGCVTPAHVSWSTQKENLSDRKKHGTELKGETHGRAVLTADQVLEIRKWSESHNEAARRYHVHKSTIASIRRKKNWSWL